MERVISYGYLLAVVASLVSINLAALPNAEALSRRVSDGSSERPPVSVDPIMQIEDECSEPSEADLKEAKEKFQKLINEKAKDAKTTEAVATEIMSKYDTSPQGGDGKLNNDELDSLLKDADIGNIFTRSCWREGLLDKFDTPASSPPDSESDRKISKDELKKALDSMGIKAPAA